MLPRLIWAINVFNVRKYKAVVNLRKHSSVINPRCPGLISQQPELMMAKLTAECCGIL